MCKAKCEDSKCDFKEYANKADNSKHIYLNIFQKSGPFFVKISVLFDTKLENKFGILSKQIFSASLDIFSKTCTLKI